MTVIHIQHRIEDIIILHYRQFMDLAVAPDDQDVLAVLGSGDECDDVSGAMNRSLWKVGLRDGVGMQLAGAEEDVHAPSWSPDGTRIAYLSRRSGQVEIWVMDRDGAECRQVTSMNFAGVDAWDGTRLLWSPDGKYIAYAVTPNGSKERVWRQHAPMIGQHYREEVAQIVVYSEGTMAQLRRLQQNPPGFFGAVYLVEATSGANCELTSREGVVLRGETWSVDGGCLLVRAGTELLVVDVVDGEDHPLYSGPADLVRWDETGISLARRKDGEIEVGYVSEGEFRPEASAEIEGYDIRLHAFSSDGAQIVGTAQEGVTNYLFALDRATGEVEKLTSPEKVVFMNQHRAGARVLHKENSVIFPYSSPTNPFEIWKKGIDSVERVSSFNRDLNCREWPSVEVVRYASDGWEIEALLVLPLGYAAGQKYPVLFFLHGGPESCVIASFTHLISARAESAAHWLAAHGYAVLLPNFRGSSGYGQEFQAELGDYQIMNHPYRDLMAGVDYLVDRGIANPDALGVYGTSFGGTLTAWTVSQTPCFKGAVAAICAYDVLHDDRARGTPFHALRPNRLGSADVNDMWRRPEMYKKISPMEHITEIKTPVMLVETGAERRGRWSQTRAFSEGLRAMGVETCWVYYPQAFHNGRWRDEYKRDYMRRLLVWFDHCVKGTILPAWFEELTPRNSVCDEEGDKEP